MNKTIIETLPKDFDPVNQPSHYLSPNIIKKVYRDAAGDVWLEAIDVIVAWNYHKCAFLFNALKYLLRAKHKGSQIQDLEKAQHYITLKIRELKAEKEEQLVMLKAAQKAVNTLAPKTEILDEDAFNAPEQVIGKGVNRRGIPNE